MIDWLMDKNNNKNNNKTLIIINVTKTQSTAITDNEIMRPLLSKQRSSNIKQCTQKENDGILIYGREKTND